MVLFSWKLIKCRENSDHYLITICEKIDFVIVLHPDNVDVLKALVSKLDTNGTERIENVYGWYHEVLDFNWGLNCIVIRKDGQYISLSKSCFRKALKKIISDMNSELASKSIFYWPINQIRKLVTTQSVEMECFNFH